MVDSRDTNQNKQSAWASVPLWRLSATGGGARDPMVWVSLGAVAAVVVGFVWLLGSIVWPLGRPGPDDAHEISPAPKIANLETPIEGRQAMLDKVSSLNMFDANRRAWTAAELARDTGDVDESGDGEEDDEVADSTIGSESGGTLAGPDGDIEITRTEDLPSDIQLAYKNLELKGIRTDFLGEMVMMLTLVQSPDRPASKAYWVGDEVTDEKFPKDKWLVVFIDDVNDHVVLSRAEKNVVLPLFKAPASGESGALGEIEITRSSVMAEMRASGATKEEIAEMLAALEADGTLASSGASRAVASNEPAPPVSDPIAAPEGAPSGAARIVEMLTKQKTSTRPKNQQSRSSFAFPDVNTYRSVGPGKSVRSVDYTEGLVVLADGSRWRVMITADAGLGGWVASDTVTVVRNRGDVQRPYTLLNNRLRKALEADHLVD